MTASPIVLTGAQLSTLSNLYAQQNYPAAYQYLQQALQPAFDSGQVDSNFKTWLDTAYLVNSGNNFVADFVDAYTASVGAINGANPPAGGMQEISNAIAHQVIGDIINGHTPRDDENFTTTAGQIPDINDVISTEVKNVLQSYGYPAVAWAGNLTSHTLGEPFDNSVVTSFGNAGESWEQAVGAIAGITAATAKDPLMTSLPNVLSAYLSDTFLPSLSTDSVPIADIQSLYNSNVSNDSYALFDGVMYQFYPDKNTVNPGQLLLASQDGTTAAFDPTVWSSLDAQSLLNDTQISVNIDNQAGSNVASFSMDTTTGASFVTSLDGTVTMFPSGGSMSFNYLLNGVISILDDYGLGGSVSGGINPDGTQLPPTATGDAFPVPGGNGAGGVGGPSMLPDSASAANAGFSRAYSDPIVLDLSAGGTGVQLTSIDSSSAYFDLHNTGFAVHTGWVGPTTGFLVQDTNNNGFVDNITELFGGDGSDGFTALQTLDTNHDNIINASDTAFAGLKVWEDSNGNGVTDSGELHSLSSLGISAINIAPTATDINQNGNLISEVATFTYSAGGSGEVAEAFFKNDQLDSTYTGSYTLNPAVMVLPKLRGYGTLAPLFIAMSNDATLLSMVQSFTTQGLAGAANYAAQIKAIIYQWAGVTNVSPTSRGSYVNAQDLGALEAFVGQSYSHAGSANPGPIAGQTLEDSFNAMYTGIAERLLVQGPLHSLFPNVGFNYASDALTGTPNLSAAVTAIVTAAPTSASGAASYWQLFAPVIQQLGKDFGIAASTYNAALTAAFTAANLPFTLDQALNNNVYVGSSGNDSYTANSSGSHYISGGAGNDNLYGNIGGDVLVGGAGNDFLQGNGGGDIYLFNRGDGQDVINAEHFDSATSALKLDASIAPSDVTVSRVNDDLVLAINGSTDKVTVEEYFYSSIFQLSQIHFSNGTTWNYATLLAKVDTGTSGNDDLRGDSANNILDGGAGNDTLTGNGGSDTYVFGTGYGHDLINNEHFDSATSVLQFQAGVTTSNVLLSRNNYDLVLSVSGTSDQVTVEDYFYLAPDFQVDIHFSDGTVWNAATVNSKFLIGTSGNDNLSGTSGDDVLDGGAGNDSLTGNGGADTYVFGRGYGQDTINNYNGASRSVVRFKSDTNPNDVVVSRTTYDLILTIAGTTDKLTVQNYYYISDFRVAAVTFTDGTSWDYNTLLAKADVGTTGNDNLIGDGGNNTLDGGAGNDTLTGSGGTDTYVFGHGYGYDTINDYHDGSAKSKVQFKSDTSLADVEIYKTSYDLIGQIDGTTDKIDVQNYFYINSFQIGSLQFSDGTTINNAALNALKLGTSGNDTVAGTTGADTFYGSAGTDTLTGGGGYDTYKIGSTLGVTTINNTVSGGTAANGEVDFLSSLNNEKLWLKQSGNNLEIDLLGTTNKVVMSNWFTSDPTAQVTAFKTADGLKLDTQVSQLVTAMATYSTNNPAFNPATATTMPTDTNLQMAISSAWHH